MTDRSIKYDSSDSESEENKPGKRNKPRKPVSDFYKGLHGSTDIKSKSENGQKIQQEVDKSESVIGNVKRVEATKTVLEAIEQRNSAKQLEIAMPYRFAMLDQAVHPHEFVKRLRLARQSHWEVTHFKGKNKTTQDIEGHLLLWKGDREQLEKLVHQMNKRPEQVNREVQAELPGLRNKAQRTLRRLESIPNWRNLVEQLKPQTKERVLLNRNLVRMYTGEAPDQSSGAINIREYIGDSSMNDPKFYAELFYRTRALDKIIDRLIKNESPAQRWQGSPVKTLKDLVSEVANRLTSLDLSQNTNFVQTVYRLATENNHQQGFTNPANVAVRRYRDHIDSIQLNATSVGDQKGYRVFAKDREKPAKTGRFVVNMHPDHLVGGRMQQLITAANGLDCVYQVKMVNNTRDALSRLDPIVIYFDATDNRNKDVVADRLRQYEQYTRPNLPVGIEPMYKGIGFGAGVESGNSLGGIISNSIMEVISPLYRDNKSMTFEILWPRVESDLRAKGIIEI